MATCTRALMARAAARVLTKASCLRPFAAQACATMLRLGLVLVLGKGLGHPEGLTTKVLPGSGRDFRFASILCDWHICLCYGGSRKPLH